MNILKLFFLAIIILSLVYCSNNGTHETGSPELNRYAGHYRVNGNYTITITSRHGFLYYQPTSQDYGDKLSVSPQQTFSQDEWGESFIEFRRTPGTEEYDLFIVNPGKPPRRYPRIDRPVVVELE
jgi:hypothetical protein